MATAEPADAGPPYRVAITGIGPITAVGTGRERFWDGLRARRSPVRQVTRFDPTPWRSRLAAEVDDFDPTDFMDPRQARRLDRFMHFAIASTRLALEDGGLNPADLDPDTVAIQFGSALGGVAYAEEQVVNLMRDGLRAVDPRVALTTFCGASSCGVAIEFGFTGPNSTNAMSCASGTIAIGEAFRLIREGTSDAAIAGGAEAPLAPLTFGAFSLIRAMSTRNDDAEHACRPFDRGRDGFVMGEGGSALLLERWDHAVARGANIYGELAGYGTTNDAHHMTAPKPDGSQAARAMRLALRSAGIDAGQVDYVSPHGSATPLNDSTETLALKTVLGDQAYRAVVSGTKAYHGHALGASGAMEVAAACLALRNDWIPPTVNFEDGGDDCDLDYVAGRGRDLRANVCLSNSFGFGGINASLVIRRAEP